MDTDPLYTERQRLTHWWLVLMMLVFTAALFTVGLLIWQGVIHDDEGPDSGVLLMALSPLPLVIIFLFFLDTKVSAAEVRLRYFPIWSRKVPIATIKKAEAITYRPMRDYGGWGIKCGFSGAWCYTTKGNEAVMLELEGGGKLMIGSQRAPELERVLKDLLAHQERRARRGK